MKTPSAESTMEGFALLLKRIEAQKCLSMTYDQGKEMSDHHDIDPSRLYHFNAEKLASLAHDFVAHAHAHAHAEYDFHGEGRTNLRYAYMQMG